jgi:hypothetical protein
VDDLMPFLYVVNHTITKKNPLPAYLLFFGETPNPVTTSTDMACVNLDFNCGSWFNANLVLHRCEKFLSEAIEMSLDVTPLGIIVIDHSGTPTFIPVINAIYDLTNMTLWRVDRSDSHIFAQRMEVWLQANIDVDIYSDMPMFSRKDIIRKHIDRLIAHSNHGSEHMQIRHTQTKKVGCVDGRQDNNKSEIGSLIGERQMMNLMTDIKTNHIAIVFHTQCGYIGVAITLHKIFRAWRAGIPENDKITLGRAKLFINTLLRKPWVKRDKSLFNELISHVDLSKVADTEEGQQTFLKLADQLVTDSQGSLRYATSHMSDRAVFKMIAGFPVMVAANNVEEALQRHKIELPDNVKSQIISEELVRLDRQVKTAFIEKNRDVICERRLSNTLPTVNWMFEDLHTGRYFEVNPKFVLEQTNEEILCMTRKDAKTGAQFTLILP